MPGIHVSVRRMRPLSDVRRAAEIPVRRRVAGSAISASLTPLSPRGVGQILDDALDVLVARFGTCIAIGTLLMLPIQIGMELLTQANLSADIHVILAQGWPFLVYPTQFFTAACVCRLVGTYLQGNAVSIGEALGEVVRRLIPIGIFALLFGVAVAAGTCCCYVPGIVLQWLFSVVLAAYLLEGIPLVAAVGRSASLVTGWGSLGRFLGYFLVSSVMLFPLTGPSSFLNSPDVRGALENLLPIESGPVGLLLAVISAFFMGIGLAYPAVLMVVFYFDCRVRKEGLDLDRELDRLIARRGGGVA